MRFATHASLSNAARLALAATLLTSSTVVHADVQDGGEKPGFIRRMFGGGKKEETPPPPPAPPPVAEKPKSPAASKPKSSTASSAKSKSSSSGSTAKKSTLAPAKKTETAVAKKTETAPAKKTDKPAEEPKKETAAAGKTESKKPETADAKTPATAKKDKEGDGEFGHDKDDGADEAKATAATAPAQPEPPASSAPLPTAAQGTGWQLVKMNGRDYVTADSIHRFYQFSSYKVEGNHVWLRSNNLIMKAQIGSQEMLINNIKFILSYPVAESGGRPLFSRVDLCKLIDPVLRPTYITDGVPFDTVVVDAGHGGHDVGARGVYGYEKDFALKMAAAVREALMRKGFKVVMTRSTDTFITLGGRVAVANATPNSIFLSFHFNSGGSAASGIETFALTPQGSSASLARGGGYNAYGTTGNSHDSANIALATAVHAMVISRFKFVDRGIKRAQWSVLTGCKRPGILFEGGFVTNGGECRLIASDTYRQSVSAAIADAVMNYRSALRGSMTNRR